MAGGSCRESGAEARFSRCGRYRWWLRRRWRDGAPTLLFLGLNPSSADGTRDDPTLRRLIGFADGWGYGAVEVMNLFSWISADPAALRQAAEPVGQRTDAWIRSRVGELIREKEGLKASCIASKTHRVPDRLRPQPSEKLCAVRACPDATLPLWLGWGNGGGWHGRDQQVLQLLSRLPVRLFCLGLTTGGQPRHPLYVPGRTPLLPFGASWEQESALIATPCPAPRAATRST